jgi:hypothetical protein
MAKRRPPQDATNQIRTLTIVQLGLAGVGQAAIRKIVGGSMGEINAIVKLIRKRKQNRD